MMTKAQQIERQQKTESIGVKEEIIRQKRLRKGDRFTVHDEVERNRQDDGKEEKTNESEKSEGKKNLIQLVKGKQT